MSLHYALNPSAITTPQQYKQQRINKAIAKKQLDSAGMTTIGAVEEKTQ